MNFVYKTRPHHTEENVLLDSSIEIVFMVDINKNTIRQECITLLNLSDKLVEAVKFHYHNRLLTVTPLQSLKSNSHYQLQIVGGVSGIKDITGRIMPETYELEFYTKELEGLKTPSFLLPTNKSVHSKQPSFKWSAVDKADYYEIQISKSNTFQNIIWPTDEDKIYSTTSNEVTPDIEYESGQYYARIRSALATGLCGSWSNVLQFYYDDSDEIEEKEEDPFPSAEAIPESIQSKQVILQATSKVQTLSQVQALQNAFSAQADTSALNMSVTSTSPKNLSVNNPLANIKQIVIEFTGDIDPTTVTTKTCYVLEERN